LNKSGAIYIIAIIAACIGGMSVAVLVKDAIVKKLLFIGLCVLFGIGILCAIPGVSLYMNLSAMFFSIVTIVIYVCLILLASLGIWVSRTIDNRIGKIILIAVFAVVLIVAISLSIFTIGANILL
jgi:hypothetical protein